MLNYIEYLKTPAGIATVLVVMFFIMQIIGELLEFKGKVVPEFVKIRKYFDRKKKERKILSDIPKTFTEVQTFLQDVKAHYSADNIGKRDKWIENVNKKLEEHDNWRKDFDKKLDKNNEDTLSLLIESKRNTIIQFASDVIDESFPVTRERFNRTFKIYEEYEDIIEKNGRTNGEVDIAIRIIKESYENHMRNHTFIEDIRGYNN